jgi:hypothetical protein
MDVQILLVTIRMTQPIAANRIIQAFFSLVLTMIFVIKHAVLIKVVVTLLLAMIWKLFALVLPLLYAMLHVNFGEQHIGRQYHFAEKAPTKVTN